MQKTSAAQKNGKNQGTATTAKKPQAAKVETKAVEKSTTKINEILNPSASSRIQKTQNFQILANKHQFLEKKRSDLEKFILSSDGTKEKVILKNAEGFEFEVSNSQVIEDVLFVVKDKLTTFLKSSEEQILKFQV